MQEIWVTYELEPGKRVAYQDAERELFVSFMLSCEICFEKTQADDRRHKKFVQRTFVAPQLLPEQRPETVRYYWKGRESLFVRYTHDFLHYGVIQRFIIRTQELAQDDDIWRDGIMIFEGEEAALVETLRTEPDSKMPANVIQIQVGISSKALLDKIRNLLAELQNSTGTESVSRDGKNFVPLEKLKNHNSEKSATIESESGDYLSYESLEIFLQQSEHTTFDHLESLSKPGELPLIPKPMKAFISYAHKDDQRYKQLFVEGIGKHSDWDIFDDEHLDMGGKWHEQLKKQVRECDFGILLLSPSFFKSDYIRKHEVIEFVKRSKESGFLIFMVPLIQFRQKWLQEWEDLAARQYFRAEGHTYGLADTHRQKQIFFDQLVRFTNDHEPIADNFCNQYCMDFVDKAEEALEFLT